MVTSRQNNKHINPKIYEAFREAENYCLLFDETMMPNKCRLLLKVYETASEGKREVSAKEYYSDLVRFGFDMPSFYEVGYKEKNPKWKFWKN